MLKYRRPGALLVTQMGLVTLPWILKLGYLDRIPVIDNSLSHHSWIMKLLLPTATSRTFTPTLALINIHLHLVVKIPFLSRVGEQELSGWTRCVRSVGEVGG